MERTLTIRLSQTQDEALTQRARMEGRTRSAMVRALIDAGLGARPLKQRAGHLKGRAALPRTAVDRRRRLRERNWR
jgi:hypothetical protein